MDTTNETYDKMLETAARLYRDYVGWEQSWDQSGWNDLRAKENMLIAFGRVRGAAEVMAAACGIQLYAVIDHIERTVTGC